MEINKNTNDDYYKLKIHLRLAVADLKLNLNNWYANDKGHITDWMSYLCPEMHISNLKWRKYVEHLTDDNGGLGILKRYDDDKQIYMIDSKGWDINQKLLLENKELDWLSKYIDVSLSYRKGTERKAIRFPF